MKKCLTYLILFFVCISIVSSIEVCEYEVDPGNECMVISPSGLKNSTYYGYWDNGSLAFEGVASELYTDTGIYNFSFKEYSSGGITIRWEYGNITGYINVKTTDETDLSTVLTNQAVLEQEILDTQLNVTVDANTTLSPEDIWNSATRTLTSRLVGNDYIATEDNSTGGSGISSEDLNISLLDINSTLSSEEIWNYVDRQLNDGTNESLTRVESEITAINNTLTLNVISYLMDSTYGLSAIKTYLVSTVYDYLVNTIKTAIDSVSTDMDANFTKLESNVDIMVNQSRDIQNLTRIQIIDSGIYINETSLAYTLLTEALLANKTITYNTPSALYNITTVYNDLGYQTIEVYTYDDEENMYYLNSTTTYRTT